MKIDKKLNLVITIAREDGSEVFVHATPISPEALSQFWDLAGPTMNALMIRGFGLYAPTYAYQMLQQVAKERGGDTEGKSGQEAARIEQRQAQELARVERGFIAELRRLTNVFVLGENGWETVALYDAQRSGLISESDANEIDNALVFFACSLSAHPRSQWKDILGGLTVCNAQISSLDCTAFRNFLPTSTAAANTGETVIP